MKRRVLHRVCGVVACITLLTGIAMAVLSYRMSFEITLSLPNGQIFAVGGFSGHLRGMYGRIDPSKAKTMHLEAGVYSMTSPRWYTEQIPFYQPPALGFGTGYNESPLYFVWLPSWFVILCSVGTCLLLLQRFRRRATLPGHCTVCGYDLRATPERCPECGQTYSRLIASRDADLISLQVGDEERDKRDGSRTGQTGRVCSVSTL